MREPLQVDPFRHLRGLVTKGPGRFITYASFLRDGKRRLWLARESRKGLLRPPGEAGAPLWLRPAYNWWIGALFAMGSLLFMLGAGLSIAPTTLGAVQVALVFFAGSIPFTTAAFLQNLQAANAAGPPIAAPGSSGGAGALRLVGWRPRDLGWLSTVTQLLGTIAFNLSTFDAIDPKGGWYRQDLTVWLPDLAGSVLFLASGYLAFMETSHGYWSWRPRDLGWRITFVNLLGCVVFMTAGLLAYVPRTAEPGWIATVAAIHLGLGGACFLIGALLTMRESRIGDASAARTA